MKKKGFTLIELLAVIVILAIIALIAVPQIMKILDKAKRKSFEQSARGILQSAEMYAAMNTTGENLDTINVADLNFKNNKDYTGKVIKKDGEYYLDKVCNKEYCISGTSDTLSQVVKSSEIRELDDTPPDLEIGTSTTSSRVLVNVKALDVESGISKIIFNIYDGETLVENKEIKNESNYEYTFEILLEEHDYIVEIKVINNSSMTDEKNTTTTKTANVTTTSLTKPEAISTPSGYSQSKTVTIDYKSSVGTYLVMSTKNVTTNVEAVTCSNVNDGAFTCNGASVTTNGILLANTWYKVNSNPTLTLEENASIYYEVSDGINYKDGGSLTITEIDTTEPSVASVTQKSATTNSITVEANGTDNESGIVRYQFSIDGGSWQPSTPQELNEYIFNGVTSGDHQVKVSVINGTFVNDGQNVNNTKESDIQIVSTGPTSENPPSGVTGYTGVKKIVYLDPTDLTKGCNSSNINSDTGTKTGCMKWYAYNDDGINYTMILDHNTTASVVWVSKSDYIAAGGTASSYGEYGNNNLGPITVTKQLASDTTVWSGNPRLITAEEIATITGNTSWTTSSDSFYFDTLTTSSTNEGKYGWLFDRSNRSCTNYGCLNNATGSNTSSYWTSSPCASLSDSAWSVRYGGYLHDAIVAASNYGLRPVITIATCLVGGPGSCSDNSDSSTSS